MLQKQEAVPEFSDSDRDVAEIPFRAEVARKLLHLIALVIPVTSLLVGRTISIWILVPLALVAVAADVVRTRNAAFNRFILKFLGFMMRPSETNGLGGRIVLNGATCVLLSAALLAVLFPLSIGMTAFIVFMLADAAAALVGRRLGRNRWPGSRRTVEGSLAFVVTGIVLYGLWTGGVYLTLLVVVLIGATAEAMPGPFNDNIRVPLVMAASVYLISLFASLPSPFLIP